MLYSVYVCVLRVLQLDVDMHYENEMQEEWVPVYLCSSSAGAGEFAAVFNVYSRRHDNFSVSCTLCCIYIMITAAI